MTRLHIMSDLHLDLRPERRRKEFIEKLKVDGDEILVLPGDICSLSSENQSDTFRLMEDFCSRYKWVVYTPGNHEFWNTNPAGGQRMLTKLSERFDNLTVLRSGKVHIIGGKRFLGDTMWFPFDPTNFMYERNMPDFKMVEDLGSWAYAQNSIFTEFLRVHCEPGDIIVTHHMPSFKSVPERFQNSQINRFFVSDQRKVIERNRPGLWIHGHTHTRFDYMLGDTRVLCNPRGYIGEQSVHDWNPELKITI
jgi:UDP-2,3-diacylglucosamine pyrophosphatase LpxH